MGLSEKNLSEMITKTSRMRGKLSCFKPGETHSARRDRKYKGPTV